MPESRFFHMLFVKPSSLGRLFWPLPAAALLLTGVGAVGRLIGLAGLPFLRASAARLGDLTSRAHGLALALPFRGGSRFYIGIGRPGRGCAWQASRSIRAAAGRGSGAPPAAGAPCNCSRLLAVSQAERVQEPAHQLHVGQHVVIVGRRAARRRTARDDQTMAPERHADIVPRAKLGSRCRSGMAVPPSIFDDGVTRRRPRPRSARHQPIAPLGAFALARYCWAYSDTSGRFCGVCANSDSYRRPATPADDRSICHIKDIPLEGPGHCADMKQHKIHHRAVNSAIDRIPDRAADNQSEREARQARAGPQRATARAASPRSTLSANSAHWPSGPACWNRP